MCHTVDASAAEGSLGVVSPFSEMAGEVLRLARRARGLTLQEAAARSRGRFAPTSIAGYERKMARLVEDIKASQVRNDQAIVERDTLNREIIGSQQAKGLRRRYNEQVEIMDRAQAEDQYVATFVTNREAEFGLLKKRRDALTGRMEELNKK